MFKAFHMDENAKREQAEGLFFEGNRLMDSGNLEAAEKCFRDALALVPDFGEALANLALVRHGRGATAEAEAYYRQSIALLPDNLAIQLNLGVLLMDRKRFSEGEVVYRQALRLAPDSPAAWTNIGVLLACVKREKEAEQCYCKALSLDNGYSKAHFNLSTLLLRRGEFEEGWRHFEHRGWRYGTDEHFRFPRWRGEPVSGKSLVISFEAGQGDMIQFCRYASVLKSMGAARLAVVCHPGLKILFQTLSGIDEVFSVREELPATGWDFWTPPMSLPHYCHTRLENIPAPIPYLRANPERTAEWEAFFPAAGLKVGLAWKGNPAFENDEDRSLPSLDVLAPLGAVRGVHFVSLQKGPGEEEAKRPPAGLSLSVPGRKLRDFADTAAIISHLDLVISVDTAVAHLAGALGRSCWVLLPDYLTDWRWMVDRTDSPWYPNCIRLFRQHSGGNWTPVIAAVADALELFKKEQDATRESRNST